MKLDRLRAAALVPLLALAAAPCAAQDWAPGGVALCQNGCPGDIPQIVSDGAGGAYVAWRDIRDYATNDVDVYLQRVTAAGLIASGWPVDGFPVAVLPGSQEFSCVARDGLGGALVAWEDNRYFPGTATDPFAQRVMPDGSLAPGWAAGGNPASRAPRSQSYPQIAPDGVGGAYLIWQDSRDYPTLGYDAYGQHLDQHGVEVPGWPGGGLALAALPGDQADYSFVFGDDSGGAVFVWSDGRPNAAGGYAQHVNADGALAPGWPANGARATEPFLRAAVRDEVGGFFAAWATAGPSTGFDGSYYLMRFRFDGSASPGWPSGGAVVCNAPGDRAGIRLDPDGAGGALLCWYDYRPPYDLTGGEIFAARVLADGSPAPGWSANGTLLSEPTDGMQSYDPFVARDGLGGGFVVWQARAEVVAHRPFST